MADLRDRFRDPKGWLIDALPWPLRRLWLWRKLGIWPADRLRYIGFRRVDAQVIAYVEELERRDNVRAGGVTDGE